MCLPTDPFDPVLARVAGEVRAAAGEAILAHPPVDDPATLPTLDVHPEPSQGLAAALTACGAAAELAHVVSGHAHDPTLTGPARSLSRRAHNDIEAAVAAGAYRDPHTTWIPPIDIHNRRVVTLPAPSHMGCTRPAHD